MNDYERNILKHIEDHGCSVTSVFDPDGSNPPFSYSIGITRSYTAPEIIVVGLANDVSHWLVNEYKRRVSLGERFAFDTSYDGFLEGFDVRFVSVAATCRKEYMRSTCWLYGGDDFEAVQLVWPDASGGWPWDEQAPEWFRLGQPILSENLP